MPAAILLCLFSDAALAQQKPAVSGLNGKFDFSAGALSLPTPAFTGRVAGALTVPLGDRFGLQADVSASAASGFSTGASLHLFTRDPDSYLLGGSFGVLRSPGAIIAALGPEAELYRDRVSVEAWGGVAMVRPAASAPARFGLFALGNVAYYPTDNWRISVGASSLDGYAALQMGSEYLLDSFDLPVAVTGEIRLGQDGTIRALAGLRTYFGADPRKTLIARHREDDPADLSSALYGAAAKATLLGAAAASPAPPTGEKSSAGATPPTDEKSSGGANEPNPGGTDPSSADGGSDAGTGGTPPPTGDPSPGGTDNTEGGDGGAGPGAGGDDGDGDGGSAPPPDCPMSMLWDEQSRSCQPFS